MPPNDDSPAARLLQKMLAPKAAPPVSQEVGQRLGGILAGLMRRRDELPARLGLPTRDADHRGFVGFALFVYGVFAIVRVCAERIRDPERRMEVVTAMFEAFAEPDVLPDFLNQMQSTLARFGHAYASRPNQGAAAVAMVLHEYIFERETVLQARLDAMVGFYDELRDAVGSVVDPLG